MKLQLHPLDLWLINKNMKQSTFARMIRVSSGQVHNYLYKNAIPKPDVMMRIYKVTNGAVTANDFYGIVPVMADKEQLCARCGQEIFQKSPVMPQGIFFENYKIK